MHKKKVVDVNRFWRLTEYRKKKKIEKDDVFLRECDI